MRIFDPHMRIAFHYEDAPILMAEPLRHDFGSCPRLQCQRCPVVPQFVVGESLDADLLTSAGKCLSRLTDFEKESRPRFVGRIRHQSLLKILCPWNDWNISGLAGTLASFRNTGAEVDNPAIEQDMIWGHRARFFSTHP